MRPRCGAKEVSATWDSSEIGHGAYRFTDFPRTTGSTEVEAIASVGDDAYVEGESVLVRCNLPPRVKFTRRNKLDDDKTTTYHCVPSITLAMALGPLKTAYRNTTASSNRNFRAWKIQA